MLTFEEAKIIGRDACVEKLGREFVYKYRNKTVTAYGDYSDEGVALCYVGVDDDPSEVVYKGYLILSARNQKSNAIPYSASCNVKLSDGTVEFLECYLPEN